jgi:predicted glycosyltransferase
MLYSQHVLGIGHFFRSMEIARALNRHEVLFVEGGDPLPGYAPPPHVERFLLPPLMMDAQFKAMEVREGEIDETKSARKKQLMDRFLAFGPDLLITELFPFGRKQFRFELMPVLQAIRQRGLPTKVVCSLRDILVEKDDQTAYETGVLEVLNSYYHQLLIHSDPKVIGLEETFQRVGEIRIPIHYTGFVARKPPEPISTKTRRTILASSGGGRVGVDLLAAAILAVQRLEDQDVELKVFAGPFMENGDRGYLEDLAGRDARTGLHPFSPDFLAEMAGADLSISMAGYNTCMDILSTGIKALVYPFPQNREQSLRAGKLEALGILNILKDLGADTLRLAIRKALDRPVCRAATAPDISGASTTALWVENEFASR